MGDLSTYALTDFIPFTRQVYLRLFERLNEAVWPAQIAMLALGVAALWAARRGRGALLGLLVGLCWVFVGVVYHLQFYGTLNWAGTYFGWSFIAEGVLLVAVGWTGRLGRPQDVELDAPGRAGLGVAASAVAMFPVLAPLTGRGWAGAEVFGISPDPTVLATLGVTLSAERLPWYTWIVPLAWCVVTGATSWGLETATGLVTAALGLVSLGLAVWKGLA